jgi:hypothetical protein
MGHGRKETKEEEDPLPTKCIGSLCPSTYPTQQTLLQPREEDPYPLRKKATHQER